MPTMAGSTRATISPSPIITTRPGWAGAAIRVWNDDRIAARAGFPPHPHRDMEIITYVRAGAITHQDSMGNKGRTGAGDVQVMSAGTGVQHAEYNLEDEQTTLFQIWVQTDRPRRRRAGARAISQGDRGPALPALASGDAEDGALKINAAARVLGATLRAGEIERELTPTRRGTSIWSPRARSGSTASAPSRATASPSPARPRSKSSPRTIVSWFLSTPGDRKPLSPVRFIEAVLE